MDTMPESLAGVDGAAGTLRIIDSHTGGEPTRLVVEGGPVLHGPFPARVAHLRASHDHLRNAVLGEPRGAEHMVGALLCAPQRRDCAAGVIFFNNVGYLGMCGHGLMGIVVSLFHLGRIGLGHHLIETPVGVVEADLELRNRVSVLNVASHRHAKDVRVEVPGHGTVHGDVAWGGNWFFLVHDHGIPVERHQLPRLLACATAVREQLRRQGITGSDGAEIDHVELMMRAPRPGIDGRSFVLCPGMAYDRSPCGTGTSAIIACEHADGRLQVGQTWYQESVIGSLFEARLVERDGALLPRITGTAHVNGEVRLIADPADPFAWGMA